MYDKDDLQAFGKTGRVRKKSAKVLEMEEFEEEERKHQTKTVKTTPEIAKASKTQSTGNGLPSMTTLSKKPKIQDEDIVVSPSLKSNIAPGTTSKLKTSPSPTTESQVKLKQEFPPSVVNVESSTKGQLAAKLKGQVITPPKKQTVQYLVEAAKIKQASITKSPTKSPIKSPLPSAAKSSIKSPLPSATKLSIKSPLPSAAKSSIKSPLPSATKTSIKSPLPSAAKSSIKSPLPSAAKSATKSPLLSSTKSSAKSPLPSPTKSSCVSPDGKNTGNKSSVIKHLLNQPAQLITSKSVIKTEPPSPPPSSASTQFTPSTAVGTPKSTKEKKSKSTDSIFSAKLTSDMSADSTRVPTKKSGRQKTKKSQSVLAAALASAPTSKVIGKEATIGTPTMLAVSLPIAEIEADIPASLAVIKTEMDFPDTLTAIKTEMDFSDSLTPVKTETDIPKLKLLLGSTEASLPSKQDLHLISPSKQGLKVMSPTGIRQSLHVLSPSKQLSIDTTPTTEFSQEKTAQATGLKMKFILSPREKDGSTQSSVMISPNITGQTISPSAKSHMTLEERLQQAAIGMKPKKSKKKKESETTKSVDAETCSISSPQKRKTCEVSQGTSTELDMPSKKKTKTSKKVGTMQSTGCNTEIYVKPSMIRKEVTTATGIKSLGESDSFHFEGDDDDDDDEEEDGLVISEKKPKPTKKTLAKKKIKSDISTYSPIPQSAMLKQVQPDNTVKVSDASVLTRDPSQTVKRSEKSKKEKKVKVDEVAKPPKKKKRPPTAYTMWCNQHRAKIVSDNPGIDFAQLSRRLGEIWQGLPAKEKMSWKRKAKRAAGKGSTMISTGKKNKRVDLFHATKSSATSATGPPRQQPTTPKNVKTSEEIVPSPVKGLGAEPVDVAAHLKLLGESLSIIGMRLQEHKGLIAVQGSLSVLLDSMLCACGPLMCLTSQVPELNGCSPNTHLNTLDNIAYYMPGL